MRERGIKTVGAVGKGAIKTQIRMADKFQAPWTVIIGITEVREGTAIIRNMSKGTQQTVKMDDVIETLVDLIGEDNLDRYSPGELLYG
jgi:histidyl-tRNA synthetase